MAFHDELAELKQALKDAGVSVDDVLARAGVNRSSWTRWGQGNIARYDRWAAVKAAANDLIALHSQDRAA
jgi:hypothetical protein